MVVKFETQRLTLANLRYHFRTIRWYSGQVSKEVNSTTLLESFMKYFCIPGKQIVLPPGAFVRLS